MSTSVCFFYLNISTMELSLCIVMCLKSKLRKEAIEIAMLKSIRFRSSFFIKSSKHLVANSLSAMKL